MIRNKLYAIICILITVSLLAGFQLACDTDEEEGTTGETIKIGWIDHLSGGGAGVAYQEVMGAKLAVEEINDAGGVLGKEIELIVRDDLGDPSKSSRIAKDLIVSDNVDFLAGTFNSANALAISQVAKEREVLFMCASAQSASITEEDGHRYVARAWSNSHSQCGPPAYYAAEQPWTKYISICGDYSWGHAAYEDFSNFLEEKNPDVTFADPLWPKYGETDFSPYITKIMSENTDAVFVGLWGAGCVAFIKQAMAAGMLDDTTLIVALDQDIKESMGTEMPEGIVGFNGFNIGIDDEWAKDWIDTIYDSMGVYPGGGSWQGYVTIYWFKEAIEKAGTVETEAVIDALDNLTMDTFVGTVTMREFDHQADGAQWIGITTFVPEYPEFAVMKDNTYIPGSEFLPSVEEVKAMRGE